MMLDAGGEERTPIFKEFHNLAACSLGSCDQVFHDPSCFFLVSFVFMFKQFHYRDAVNIGKTDDWNHRVTMTA